MTTLPDGTGLHHLAAQVWKALEQAPHAPGHPWRTPVLASADASGSPDARVMVLRDASAANQTLLLYTDARSPKATALAQRPDAVLLFWDPTRQWQLRVRCAVSVIDRGAELAQRWQQVRGSRGAVDYLSALAPGAALPAGPNGVPAPGADSRAGHHFAMLRAAVHQIDWLELSRSGHRRALIRDGEVTPLQP